MTTKKKMKRIWTWTDPSLSAQTITTRYTSNLKDRAKAGAQTFESATPT